MEENKLPIENSINEIFGSLDRQSAAKRDVEILAELTNILNESQKIKGSYRINETKPNQIDFFLGEQYIESSTVAPVAFLEFRVRTLEQGFYKGVVFSIQKVLEKIQTDRTNESKRLHDQ